jgi:hypothetical protein
MAAIWNFYRLLHMNGVFSGLLKKILEKLNNDAGRASQRMKRRMN